MHFTLRYSQSGLSASKPFVVPAIYPFPLIGKFKVRVVGYEATSTDYPGSPYICLTSRALLNPLQPEYFFSFLSTIAPINVANPNFSKTGWWEVDLNGSIDILARQISAAGAYSDIVSINLIVHLEIEKLE